MTRARAGAPKLVDRETALLADQLRKAWRVREASSPIHAVLKFEAEGLVLGAGTILAEPGADLTPGGAGETRLTTLLAAAYGRRMTKDVVGHIRSANARWREADQRLADLHLALTRLERLPQPREAARRLFMADGLMRAGAEPVSILKALDIDDPASAPMAKYSADQLRAPAGNGVFSVDGCGKPRRPRRRRPLRYGRTSRAHYVAERPEPRRGWRRARPASLPICL